MAYDARAELPLVRPSTDADRWYVEAEIGGLGPALWLVDTGYTNSTCDDALVEALGLPSRPHGVTHVEPRGTVEVRRATLPPFLLAGHHVEDLVCLVRDLGTTSSVRDPPEVPVAGVLGLDVWSRFRLELDPSAPSVALSAPGEPLPDDAVRVRVTRGPSPRAKVEVTVFGRRSWMLLDTGTATTWVDGRRRGWAPTAVVGRRATYDLPAVEVGGLAVSSVTAAQRDRPPWRSDLVGLDVVSGFRWTLDPALGRVALRPVSPAAVPAWTPASPDGRGLVMPAGSP